MMSEGGEEGNRDGRRSPFQHGQIYVIDQIVFPGEI